MVASMVSLRAGRMVAEWQEAPLCWDRETEALSSGRGCDWVSVPTTHQMEPGGHASRVPPDRPHVAVSVGGLRRASPGARRDAWAYPWRLGGQVSAWAAPRTMAGNSRLRLAQRQSCIVASMVSRRLGTASASGRPVSQLDGSLNNQPAAGASGVVVRRRATFAYSV
jgi:hypothetical protein